MVFYNLNLCSNSYYIYFYNNAVTYYYRRDYAEAASQFSTAADCYKDLYPSDYKYLLRLRKLVLYCRDLDHNRKNNDITGLLVKLEENKIKELKAKIGVRS